MSATICVSIECIPKGKELNSIMTTKFKPVGPNKHVCGYGKHALHKGLNLITVSLYKKAFLGVMHSY